MDLETLRTFLMWCTIINGVMLTFSAVVCSLAGGWIYRFHGKLFPMNRETFNVVIYAFLGAYKIFFFMFNLVPFVALLIIA